MQVYCTVSFFHQHDGPVHTEKLAQDCIATNCSEFIGKELWPPNSSDVNSLDCHVWGVMLEHYKTFHSKPKNTQWTEESLAVNMGPAAAGINQQGHLRTSVKAGMDISNAL